MYSGENNKQMMEQNININTLSEKNMFEEMVKAIFFFSLRIGSAFNNRDPEGLHQGRRRKQLLRKASARANCIFRVELFDGVCIF